MDGETTSRAGIPALIRFVPRMWAEWARFVRAPGLPDERQAFGRAALIDVGQLLVLTIAIDFALVLVLGWLSTKLGVKTPEFKELTRFGPVVTLAAGALGLPILEETLFRGWLTGRRRVLVLVQTLLVAAILMAVARFSSLGRPASTAALVLLGLWILVSLARVWRASGETPAWFARAFPMLFFVSALLFGLAHISNYDMARPLLLLPFVVPQTIAATIFGFARVRYGMWANIALHGLSNGLFLGLTLSGF